jgi:hypothetical protein
MAQIDDEIQMILERQNQRNAPTSSGDPEIEAILAAQGAAPKKEEPINILNEESEIGFLDRAAVKNFGGSIEDQIDFLKRRNENLDIKQWEGEIIAKRPEEKEWKKLDPTGVTSIGEAFKDAVDVGTDIGSGALTSIAGAAGAVPGALFGFGAGGLATGAAASAAASAGLETVKQAIGKYVVGARKEMGGGEIALSGVLGGATTGLLGAGASKKIIEKAASKPEVVKNVLNKIMENVPKDLEQSTKVQLTKEFIEQGQEGLLKGAFKNFASKWSGIPKEELVRATDQVPKKLLDDFAKLEMLKPNKSYNNLQVADIIEREGIEKVSEKAQQEVFDNLKTARSTTSQKLKTAFQKSDENTGLQYFGQPLIDLRNNLIESGRKTGTDAYEPDIQRITQVLQYLGPEDQLTVVKPSDVFDIKNRISDLINWSKSPAAALKQGPVSSVEEGALKAVERQMADYLDDVLKRSKNEGLRQEYAKHMEYSEYLYPLFKDKDTAFKTITNPETLARPNLKNVIKNFDKQYTANLGPLTDIASTWRYFGRPAREPVGGGGGVKALRGTAVGGSLGYIGGLLTGIPGAASTGFAIGGGLGALASTPAAMKGVLQAETAASRALGGVANQFRAQQLQDASQGLLERLPASEYTQSALNKQAAAQSVWNLMKGK